MLEQYRKILFENDWSIRPLDPGSSFLTGMQYVLWCEVNDKPHSFFSTIDAAVAWCEKLVKECNEQVA
jgi:hypothetical protein